MKILSLKLKDDIFRDVELVVKQVHMPRNAYINKALHAYNELNKRKLLRQKLHRESAAVESVSLEVLREMEAMDDDTNLWR
jgi:hypothetical protein